MDSSTDYAKMNTTEQEFNQLSKKQQKRLLRKHQQGSHRNPNAKSGPQSNAGQKNRDGSNDMPIEAHFSHLPTDKKGNSLIKRKVTDINQYKIKIYQYSVGAINDNDEITNWGCDDRTYLLHPELVYLVPRSYSIITLMEDGVETIEARIMGLPKFGALLDPENGRSDATDEDNDSLKPTGLSIDNMKRIAVSVYETDKVNGKFCLISAIRGYLIVGSKGVHRPIPLEKIGNEYHLPESTPSYMNGLIGDIYEAFKRQYDSSRHGNVIELLMGGRALVGEYSDGKHMTTLEDGESPYIEFFGISTNNPSPGDLTGDIMNNIKFLEDNGFRVAKYKKVSLEQHFRENTGRLGWNSEGRVDYYIDTDGKVVGIAKYKTTWYILIRMLREIIKNCDPSRCKNRIRKTLIARNSFLHLPLGYLSIWNDLLGQFVDWFVSKGYENNVVGIQEEAIGMGNVWALFLKETPEACDQHLAPLEEMKKRGIPEDATFNITFQNKLVVILQGIPGIGKNAIADNLVENLGKRVYVLDQDRYAHLGRKPASKKGREVFNDTLYSDEYDIIILARNNATSFQYTSYLDMAQDALWKTVVVRPNEVDTTRWEELIAVCSEGVLTRENHPTLNGTPNERLKIVALFAGFLKSETPRVSSTIHSVETLSYLKESTEFDPELGNQIRKALANKETLPIVSDLKSHRRSIADIASDLNDIIERNINKEVPDYNPIQEPEPLYYGLFPPSEMKDWMKTVIRELNEVSNDTSTTYLGHTTLMHSSDIGKNSALWNELKQMSKDDKTLELEIYGYVTTNKDTIVVLVRVIDNLGKTHYVNSGIPHITGVLPRKVKAYESVNILKGLRMEDGTYENEVLFDTPRTYELKVTAYMQ